MASLDSQLQRWLEAGLLDSPAAERIRDFEKARESRSERPTVIEAVTYLGIAIIGVGAIVLLATSWEDLGAVAQAGIPAVAAVAALLLGQLLRVSAMPELRRGGTMAWLLGLVLAVVTIGIIFENTGFQGPTAFLVLGLIALPVSIVLWAFSRTAPQLIGVGGAAFLFSVTMQARIAPDEGGPMVFGLTLAGLSALGVALTELNVAVPRLVARTLFGLGVVAGAFFSAVGDSPLAAEALSFVAGAALIWLSLRRGVFVYIGFGIAALFLGLVTAIIRHVDEPTVAAIALIVIGLMLIGGVVALARLRPWARRHTPGQLLHGTR